MQSEEIYESQFVRTLFNEMSATYGMTNFISSFGFCRRWRVQCVELVPIRPGMLVYDLMTGMGECWHLVVLPLKGKGKLVGLDFSAEMCARALERRDKFQSVPIEVLQEDFLANTLPDSSADCIISCFGLKTFSATQLVQVTKEINRVLKPGGTFSLLEISVPACGLLRIPYMFYLKRVIPLIGQILLGNPDNYRMLGIYTEKFKNTGYMRELLEGAGLKTEQKSFFFGCATALTGKKAA